MERLTNIGLNGEIWITDNDETRKFGRKETAYKKLAQYEDLEEQGLLLRLQFKIGQKVYYIYKSCIDRNLMIGSMIYSYSCLDFPREYFATKEEAERKLKEMNTDNGIAE